MKIDADQVKAVEKRIGSNASDVANNRHAVQTGACRERKVPNIGHAVWNCDTNQIFAITECPAPDTGDIVGNYNVD